jgi:hypothetical protein
MSKQWPSLEALAQAETAVLRPVTSTMPPTAPAEPRIRRDRPHVSLYLDKRVQRVIKRIAADTDRRAHDVYLEAVDLLLRHYGQPSRAELAPDGMVA